MAFVGQPLKPDQDGGVFGTPAPGAPVLPRRFRWRDGVLEVGAVVRLWRDTASCSHGGTEKYVRRHWFELRWVDGSRARVYFERQARRGGSARTRWWLFSLEEEVTHERP